MNPDNIRDVLRFYFITDDAAGGNAPLGAGPRGH